MSIVDGLRKLLKPPEDDVKEKHIQVNALKSQYSWIRYKNQKQEEYSS